MVEWVEFITSTVRVAFWGVSLAVFLALAIYVVLNVWRFLERFIPALNHWIHGHFHS